MKKLFRSIVGLILVGPPVLMTYLFSLFIGKERAIRMWGPSLTKVAQFSVRHYFVGDIKDASEFNIFSERMKKNLRFWKPLYDVSVAEENRDIFKLNVSNCPFCETIIMLGLPEMAPYVCQGDWEVAKENAHKWEFKREHEIGKGDTFCDHTYMRKENTHVT